MRRNTNQRLRSDATQCHGFATEVGVLLMVARATSSHNQSMEANTTDAPKPRRKEKNDRIGELSRAIDDRDETIRLLNEALSRALDELTGEHRAAA